jgi:hypothetical protein
LKRESERVGEKKEKAFEETRERTRQVKGRKYEER